MLNKKIKGSIRTAGDFWFPVLFLVFAGMAIYYTYGFMEKSNNKVVANKVIQK